MDGERFVERDWCQRDAGRGEVVAVSPHVVTAWVFLQNRCLIPREG